MINNLTETELKEYEHLKKIVKLTNKTFKNEFNLRVACKKSINSKEAIYKLSTRVYGSEYYGVSLGEVYLPSFSGTYSETKDYIRTRLEFFMPIIKSFKTYEKNKSN